MPTSGSTFSLLLAVFALSSFPGFAAPQSSSLWTAGDFNGDHRPDVAVLRAASPGAPAITTVLSGASSYASSFDWPSASAVSLTTRDVDADHDADLVLRSAAGRTLRIWLNDGSARFAEVEPAAFAQDLDRQQPPSGWLARRIRPAHRGAAGLARVLRHSFLATAPAEDGTTPAPPNSQGPVATSATNLAQDTPYQPSSPLRGPPTRSLSPR